LPNGTILDVYTYGYNLWLNLSCQIITVLLRENRGPNRIRAKKRKSKMHSMPRFPDNKHANLRQQVVRLLKIVQRDNRIRNDNRAINHQIEPSLPRQKIQIENHQPETRRENPIKTIWSLPIIENIKLDQIYLPKTQ
jgi:hypothetical protein